MTQMSHRRVVPVVVILLIGVVCAEDRLQSELRFAAPREFRTLHPDTGMSMPRRLRRPRPGSVQ